jgi:predicted phage tail protein
MSYHALAMTLQFLFIHKIKIPIMLKSILILLFAAVNTGLMAVPFSSEPEIPVRISPSNKWIIIDKAGWKSPKLEVSIQSVDGTTLINENIRTSTRYNLKNVPEGKYILQLEDDQKIRIQYLQVSNDMMFSTGISTVYKPHTIINANHIDMNLMTQGQPAEVSILDAESKAVFTEKITNEVSVTRRYNISQLPEGEYTMVVKMSDQQFHKPFSI